MSASPFTLCTHCKEELRKFTAIHAAGGHLYCSRECAVAHIADDIRKTADERANEIYNDIGEIVSAMSIIRDEIVSSQSEEA